jgi:PAS domain S-box-containing protein
MVIANFLEERVRTTQAMAVHVPEEIIAEKDARSAGRYLGSMLRAYPEFDNGMFLLDTAGTMWAAEPPEVAVHVVKSAFRDYFQQALRDGATVFNRPQISAHTGTPGITFAVPLRDAAQRIQGFLGCSMKLLSPHALGGVSRERIGRDGYLYVIDHSRMIIAHPQEEQLFRRDLPPGINALLAGAAEGHGEVGEVRTGDGVAVFTAVSRVPGTDWLLAAQLPVEEAYEPLRTLNRQLLGAIAAGALTALGLGLLAVRRMTRPLLALRTLAREMARAFTGDAQQGDRGTPHIRPEARRFSGDEEFTEVHQALVTLSETLSKTAESHQRLLRSWEETFDAVPEMVFLLDRELRVVRFNRAVQQQLRLPAEHIHGRSCDEVFSGAGFATPLCPQPAALPHHTLTRQEIEEPHSRLFFDMSTTPLADEQGQVTGYVHVARDITARKLVEEALRESERTYRTLFDSALDAILILDGEGSVVDCNPAAESLFRASRREILRASLRELLRDPAGREAVDAQQIHALERLACQGHPQRFECSLETAAGVWTAMEISLSRMDVGGERGMLALVCDVSRRKEVEKLLSRERGRLAALLDGSPLGTFLIDSEHRVILWNRACEALTRIPRHEVLGKPLDLRTLLEKPSSPVLAELLLDMDEAELLERFGKKGVARLHPDLEAFEAKGAIVVGGEKKLMNVIAAKIKDLEGNMIGVMQCVQDITVSEQLQAQLFHAQKMESIGTLAGGMAHEFNNILAAIQGYTQLAQMDAGSREPLAKYLQVILAGCQRASALVRNMLTFARTGDGRKIPLKINQLLEKVRQLLRQTLPPNITLELDLADRLPFLLADPNQLQQAILNLAVNAKDAMPQGGMIRFRTRLAEGQAESTPAGVEGPPGHRVEILVEDTGEGIPRENIERVFDPFFTTKAPGKGTGLGLSIVYAIVEAHDGKIGVENAPGGGTRFALSFPAIRDDATAALAPMKQAAVLAGGHESILVVDDEAQLRDLVREVLETHGYRVTLAASGEEALQLHRSAMERHGPFDLIVLDLAMPGMTGQHCLRELVRLAPRAKVLVMSGLVENLKEEELLQHAQGLLKKPFQIPELLAQVREILTPPAPAVES